VVLFRNSGPRSGASLAHPHTQIMGLELIPPAMRAELEALADHRRDHDRCLACELVGQELAQGDRILGGEGGFVSYLPYAGRFPGELCITSREHPPPFGELGESDLRALTAVLMDAVRRTCRAFAEPSFNWVLHTVTGDDVLGGHHWRFDLLPRLGQFGGFELGTGLYINSIPPEEAVLRLRAAAD
jgi:UDPglucose--hexose-1-phosphate uridylyltransferase